MFVRNEYHVIDYFSSFYSPFLQLKFALMLFSSFPTYIPRTSRLHNAKIFVRAYLIYLGCKSENLEKWLSVLSHYPNQKYLYILELEAMTNILPKDEARALVEEMVVDAVESLDRYQRDMTRVEMLIGI